MTRGRAKPPSTPDAATPKPAKPKPATPKPATPKPAKPKPATPKPAKPKPAKPKLARSARAVARVDALGDPLPAGAVARLGTDRLRRHAAWLEVSDDGRRLALGQRGAVEVSDAETGALQVELPCPGREGEDARPVRFAPDGGEVAAVLGGQLRVFDLAAAAERGPRPPGTFADAVYAPDGAWLVAESADPGAPLVVFDRRTLAPARQVPLPGAPAGLAFGPDGRLLAARVVGGEVAVRVVDPATGAEAARLAPVAGAGRVVLGHDGARVLAVVGRPFDGGAEPWLVAWSAADGRVLDARPLAPGQALAQARVSRDGRTLAVRTRGGPLRVLDAASLAVRRELSPPHFDAAALWPDGGRVAHGASVNRTSIVDVATGRRARTSRATPSG